MFIATEASEIRPPVERPLAEARGGFLMDDKKDMDRCS